MEVGLQLLTVSTQNWNKESCTSSYLIVNKSELVKKSVCSSQFGYLKSCHSCYNKLLPDKDVYMYRGDNGFCSKECRDRQIAMDEKRELEMSTKHMVASYRYCQDLAVQQDQNRPPFIF